MTHILLIEDNPIDVRLLQRFLGALPNWAVGITWIDDGQKALRYLGGLESGGVVNPPDMVLLDVNIPRYDGLQVLAAFRHSVVGIDLPVFLWSSAAPDEIEAMAVSQNLRADAYIKKPIGLAEFEQLAQRLMQASRANSLEARTAAA